MVFIGDYTKYKCRSIAKAVSGNMQMVKSYGPNKFVTEIMAISCNLASIFPNFEVNWWTPKFDHIG
jgi:hypothetical protein